MKKKKSKNLDLSPNVKGNEQVKEVCPLCGNDLVYKTLAVYCSNIYCDYYKQTDYLRPKRHCL